MGGYADTRVLDLAESRLAIVQIDVDDMLFKVRNAFRSMMHRFSVHRDPEELIEVALPSLRSHGLSLVDSHPGTHFKNRVNRAKQLEESGNSPVLLDADDLMRGYRVDVWDDTSKRWHSLCQREATYTFMLPEATARSFQIRKRRPCLNTKKV